MKEYPVKKAGTISKGKADEMGFRTKEEYFKFIECRNKICHGIQLNFGTREHALKSILTIDMMI